MENILKFAPDFCLYKNFLLKKSFLNVYNILFFNNYRYLQLYCKYYRFDLYLKGLYICDEEKIKIEINKK